MDLTAALTYTRLLKRTTYRTGCCKYQHEQSADCKGVGAPTATQNWSSFREPNVPLFLPRYARPTPEASSSGAQFQPCSRELRINDQGLDKCWRALSNDVWFWLLHKKGANKKPPEGWDFIRQLQSTGWNQIFARSVKLCGGYPSLVAPSTANCSRYVGISWGRIQRPFCWLLPLDQMP